MKQYLRSILLAIGLIVVDYGLILVMRVVTSKIIWLRLLIIYLIFQVSLFIYFRLVRPADLNRFTRIILLVFSSVTILLTLLQHALLANDLRFIHALPLILIIASILFTYKVYDIAIKRKDRA